MNQDLTFEYRPKRFEDFWSQAGAVLAMRKFMDSGNLPRSTILTGIWGSGKTSLAMLVGQKASCLKIEDRNPCYECTGCKWVDTRIATYGGRYLVYGGDFRIEELLKFCRACREYPAPDPYRIWVPIIDEVQFIDQKTQQRLVHLIDSVDSARFIFCSSDLNQVEEAIRKRSQIFEMPVPQEQEAVDALIRIAKYERIAITPNMAMSIVRAKSCNPRDCLIDLHHLKGTGLAVPNGGSPPTDGPLVLA